jgi:hypothetical protein
MVALLENSSYLSEIYSVRSRNLLVYAERFKSQKEFAKILGISPARLHSITSNQETPFSEKIARAIEHRMNLPTGYLDQQGFSSDKNSVPIFLIEDIIDLENATPSAYIPYAKKHDDCFFVHIINRIYEPHIPMGSKLFINRKKCSLEESKLYLLKIVFTKLSIKPVIRLFKHGQFINLATGEAEEIENYIIAGECVEMISIPLLG